MGRIGMLGCFLLLGFSCQYEHPGPVAGSAVPIPTYPSRTGRPPQAYPTQTADFN
ncbi:hypothetical protein LY76DRAFT_593652 [Colletotrichum caudatum]|nr:hypothetical protein LY76DRAFT_593652 [Colletotrichum caudatum]